MGSTDFSIEKTDMETKMHNHGDTFRQKGAFYDYTYESFIPPLKVISCIVSEWGNGDFFRSVDRRNLSISIITAGNATFCQGTNEGVLETGELFLARPGGEQELHTGPLGYMHKRTIIVDGDSLESLLVAMGLYDKDTVGVPNVRDMIAPFRECHRIMREKPEGFISTLSHMSYRILLELSRCTKIDYPPEIRRAINYINHNIHNKITLDDIARAAHLSGRHCTRLFKRHLGYTPITFYMSQRMRLAIGMLRNTHLSVKQIADNLGYKDPFHFSLQFKNRYGSSPSLYREYLKK